MNLGGLYQRLLVAAGAVALLVVNWFCQPTRRRTLPPPQASLQEALLGPEDTAVDNEPIPEEKGSQVPAPVEGQLSQPESAQEMPNDAPVAPENVLVKPIADSQSDPNLSFNALAESQAEPPAKGPQHQPPVAPQPEAAPGEAAAKASNPVDEDYLKSLLDQEFGPPKFAVRKESVSGHPKPPNQPSTTDELSLQELLDQAFGPPKFAVPKQPSPPPQAGLSMEASAEDSEPAEEQDPGTGARMDLDEAVQSEAALLRSGVKRVLQEEVEEGGFVALTLTVTQGPAAGKVFVADNPAAEYKIGRLPDCSLQILDQEISGRHASVRWDPVDRQWKLHDVGSLNGTSVDGTAIGRDYKVPGPEQPLADGATVVLGSVTQLSVKLTAAAPAAAAAAVGAAIAAAAKRHHASSLDSGPEASSGSLHERNSSETLSGLFGLQGGMPAPLLLQDFPALGARLCVHNQLGVDHKRMGQGCEDVPYWEMPYEPYTGAGILCVFDGHHGSKAANQAKEHVPAVLRAKLLRRDGRTAPPLPPPPPPPQRLTEDEEEGASDQDLGLDDPDQEQEQEEEAVGKKSDTSKQDGEEAQQEQEQGGSGQEGAADEEVGANAGEATVAAAGGDGKEAADEAEEEQEEEVPPEELLPPPPEGPPLPTFLRGRELRSQQALLKETFLQSDQYMSMEEGCTATVVLLEADPQQGWTLQSANVGDSSAVLVNFTKGTWVKLSEDHRIASSVSERERLAARGHTVRTRLYGLNISRMLGDRFLKEEDLGFLAEPYVGAQATVDAGDFAMLVIASDGLWDALPEERAAKLLLQEASRVSSSPYQSSGAAGPSVAFQYGTVAASPGPPHFGTRAPSASGSSGTQLTPPVGGPFPSGGAAAGGPPLGCQAVADLLLTQALALRSKDDITISVLEMGPHLRPGQP